MRIKVTTQDENQRRKSANPNLTATLCRHRDHL